MKSTVSLVGFTPTTLWQWSGTLMVKSIGSITCCLLMLYGVALRSVTMPCALPMWLAAWSAFTSFTPAGVWSLYTKLTRHFYKCDLKCPKFFMIFLRTICTTTTDQPEVWTQTQYSQTEADRENSLVTFHKLRIKTTRVIVSGNRTKMAAVWQSIGLNQPRLSNLYLTSLNLKELTGIKK